MQDYVDPITGEHLNWLGVDEFFVLKRGQVGRTVLGSCVGIVLYDLQLGVFALNHYLNETNGTPLCKKMLSRIISMGAKEIKAEIHGGAKVLQSGADIGELNIDFAKAFLKANGIRKVKQNVGGDQGRTISVRLEETMVRVDTDFHGHEAQKTEGLPDSIRQTYESILAMSKKR